MGTIKRVLASVAQALTSQEQKQARENIGITELIDYLHCTDNFGGSVINFNDTEWSQIFCHTNTRCDFDDNGLLDVTFTVQLKVLGSIIEGTDNFPEATVSMISKSTGNVLQSKDFPVPMDNKVHSYPLRFVYKVNNHELTRGVEFKLEIPKTCYNNFGKISPSSSLIGYYFKEAFL